MFDNLLGYLPDKVSGDKTFYLLVDWGFYGRRDELLKLKEILARGRWFFAKLTGRRRIGKTTLIQQALPTSERKVLYVQVPDSGPAGVLSAVADALETFQVDTAIVRKPASLRELARMIGQLARAGYVVVLDEFQYFNRERLYEFCSHLQQEVDGLSATADAVPGGLLVLGSIHIEITALLEDRAAPLYGRVTDEIALGHLDIESLVALLSAHAEPTPDRLLFLWRFGSCKRNADRLVGGLMDLDNAVGRFLVAQPHFATWTIEKIGIAPTITADLRARLHAAGYLAQDLADLTAEFR